MNSAFTSPAPFLFHKSITSYNYLAISRTIPTKSIPLTRRRLRASLNSPPNENGDVQLANLQSDNQLTQIRALLFLENTPPNQAVSLIHESGVLDSSSQQVRLTAFAMLGKLGVLSQASMLISFLETHDDHAIRAAAANALGNLLESDSNEDPDREQIIHKGILALLRAATEDEHFIVRYASIVAAGNAGNVIAIPTLLPIAQNIAAPPLEAAAAVTALGEVLDALNVDGTVLDTVKTRAGDREDLVRAAVARTLGEWRSIPEATLSLEKMQENEVKYGQSNLVQTILSDLLENNTN